MGMIKCKDCKFWLDLQQDDRYGVCHRHAPSPQVKLKNRPINGITGLTDATTYWPETLENEWCGEFQEAKLHPLWRRWFE